MKHIVENKIVRISTNSENPNFPVSTCLDLHPKRKYRSTDASNNVVLGCGIVGGCSDIMLAGTNAVAAQVVVEDPCVMEWMNGYWLNASGNLIPAANSTLNNQGGADNIRAAFIYNILNDSDLGKKATELGFGQINLVLGQIPSPPPAGLTIRTVGGTIIYTKIFATDIKAVFMLNCVAYAVMSTGEIWSYNFITEVETTNSSVTGSANDMAMMIPVGRSNAVDDEMPKAAMLLGTNDKAILLDGPAGVGTTVTLCDASGDDINNVAFDNSSNIWMVNETQASVDVFLAANTVANSTTPDYQFDTTTKPAIMDNPNSTKRGFCSCENYMAYGSSGGLTLIGLDRFAFIDLDYNTGWMGTGIKRAYLCEAFGTTMTISSPLSDRSKNGGSLTVTGTLSLSPMVTGADKQGLSGFSNSNYGYENYDTDFALGTDDFYFEFWIEQGANSVIECPFSFYYHNGSAFSGSGMTLYIETTGLVRWYISDDGFSTYDRPVSTTVVDDGIVDQRH
jgi:hypothetical protein